jgi:exodeoxyribonuclease VII large subunit
MEPSGSGALALAYEQLKKKLETKGYFDQNIKKPLPKFPKTIAIVTSKTGAALQDMKRVASKRWALVKIVLFDTVVQGESAAFSIATNIKKADTIGADIIIVGRGGGSLEDLWAFNEEVVADAIFQANTPIISAVGHEIDFMISDGVSDLRAPTPSAAMELALPDINEMRLFTDSLMENFIITMKRILLKKSQEVQSILSHYKQNSFKSKISFYEKEIKVLKERFHSTFSRSILDAQREYDELKKLIIKEQSHILFKKEHLINTILQTYKSQDPSKKDKIGIAHIVKNGKKINLESLSSGDKIELQSSKTILEATILNKKSL